MAPNAVMKGTVMPLWSPTCATYLDSLTPLHTSRCFCAPLSQIATSVSFAHPKVLLSVIDLQLLHPTADCL